jgi:hypothetical protein
VVKRGSDILRILFRDASELIRDEIIGKGQMAAHGGWMAYLKFFDNMGPIARHVHLKDEHVRKVNAEGKPEGYFFPAQQNSVCDNSCSAS